MAKVAMVIELVLSVVFITCRPHDAPSTFDGRAGLLKAASNLRPTLTRVREQDGSLRAEVVHAKNASSLLVDNLALDDPGAPEKTPLELAPEESAYQALS